MGFIIIYITYPDLKTAKKIVASLMESRLIACGNFSQLIQFTGGTVN
ncbi:divalent cation tolerance protein CutA [Patescibacteria group bacterium]|nr:divalent cation tolerance protein CutA [Patescibacteria group bacterium]